MAKKIFFLKLQWHLLSGLLQLLVNAPQSNWPILSPLQMQDTLNSLGHNKKATLKTLPLWVLLWNLSDSTAEPGYQEWLKKLTSHMQIQYIWRSEPKTSVIVNIIFLTLTTGHCTVLLKQRELHYVPALFVFMTVYNRVKTFISCSCKRTEHKHG